MEVKKLRVLFVGNSYTYFNKMPHTFFVDEAKASGYDVESTEITAGGYRLCQYADPENNHGKRLRATIDGQHYDFAVLQEQSLNPIKDEAQFLAGVEGVKALIDADKFILYATWGRNDGSPQLEELGLTREEMTEKLSLAYNKAGQIYGMGVAEVGKAFLAYAENADKDELYNPDKSHPSPLGSSIAAKVIWEEMIHSR
jgi:hypothetical protein